MSITRKQAEDLLEENYGGHWSWDDAEWWQDMVEMLTEFPSVKALRRDQPDFWRVPVKWPGAVKVETDPRASS